MRRTHVWAFVVAVGCVAIGAPAVRGAGDDAAAGLARELLRRGGVTRGLCCVLGAGDGRLALAIVRGSGLTVHVLDDRESAVAAARDRLDVDGLWVRRVVVETHSTAALPHASGTVDLVVAAGLTDAALSKASASEIVRVLRPGGRAILGRAKAAGGALAASRLRGWLKGAGVAARVAEDDHGLWAEIVKPPRPGTDGWSHWNHGPDNNTVSADTVIKAPYMTQWYARPYYVAMPVTTVAAGGRVFVATGHIAHHRREWAMLNTLMARNGYNGALLWQRKLPDGYMVHRSAFIAADDVLYLLDGDRCLVLDAETGRETGEVRIPRLTEKWEWMAMSGGKLYVLSGKGSAVQTTRRSRLHGHWSWRDLSKGYYGKRVPWGFGRTITAYDMKARRVLWQRREDSDIDSRAMVMGGGKLFFYCPDARLGCVDAGSGSVGWINEDANTLALIEQPGRKLISTPGFKSSCFAFYTPKALLYEAQTRMNLVAVSPKDGRLIWQKRKITNNPNPIYVDGKVVIGIGPGGSHVVLDPATGKTLKDLHFRKRSCVRLTATTDSFFVRGEGLLRYDRASGKVLVNGAVRAGCNDGAIPANGLLYLGPWLCDCNLSLMGMLGMCSAGTFRGDRAAEGVERLERGSARAPAAEPLTVSETDWPCYRGDASRRAASKAAVPAKVARRWHYRPPAETTPTPPVAAGGLVFLAGQDGKVLALDARTGKRRWCFRTAGPILMPPTVAAGRAYVGSGDGCVYALDAARGRLLWRFRAAPTERRIMLYGSLGATWPVNTGVLVAGGVAYFAAGVIDYDGTSVYALDAATGRLKWQNHTSGHLNRELRKGVSAQGTMTVFKDRLLMAGGNQISPGEYDVATGKCLSPPPSNGMPKTNRGQEVCVFAGRWVIFGGRLLYSGIENVVSPAYFHVRGPKRGSRLMQGRVPPAWDDAKLACLPGQRGALFCCDSAKLAEALARPDPPPSETPRKRRVPSWALSRLTKDQRRWTAAKISAANTLCLAVAANAVLAVHAETPPDGPPRWAVSALDDKTGKPLWRVALPSRPLPGGLAVDRAGQVIVACQNGQAVCLGPAAGG